MESDASWRTSDVSGTPRAARAGLCEAYRTELDEAEVVKQYAAMVTRIARHLKGRLPEEVQLDDLVQAGLIAVLRIARHTESLLAEDTPLRRSVMNAMIDEARRTAWAPTRTVKLAKAAATAMRAIRRRTGRDGSDEEVAAELGISLAQYHQVLVELAGIRRRPHLGVHQGSVAGGQADRGDGVEWNWWGSIVTPIRRVVRRGERHGPELTCRPDGLRIRHVEVTIELDDL